MSCKEEKDNPVYIKAYTVSRCVNSCGKKFFDCSCRSDCIRKGSCCSDYRFCQVVEENHITNSKIPNCKLADEDDKLCLQCVEDFYYFNNQCLKKCPENLNKFDNNNKNSKIIVTYEENKICKEINKDCNVKNFNCEKCDNGKCEKCRNGFYLHENNCMKSCPVGLRANRINFTCVKKNNFSFYWIFPSNSSCVNKCGNNSINSDCSCNHTCLRRGNCCDDFEMECKDEIEKENCKICDECVFGKCMQCKEKSFLNSKNNTECLCKEGFSYDIEEDICLPISDKEKSKLESVNNLKLFEKKILNNNFNNKNIINSEKISNNKIDILESNNNQVHNFKKTNIENDTKSMSSTNKEDVLLKKIFENYYKINNINNSQKTPNYVKLSENNKNINKHSIHNVKNHNLDSYSDNYEKISKTPKSQKNILYPVLNSDLYKSTHLINSNEENLQKISKSQKLEKNIFNPPQNLDLYKSSHKITSNLENNTNIKKDLDKNFHILDVLNNEYKGIFPMSPSNQQIQNNKPEKNINRNPLDNLNNIINKNLSEELLNSFKKLFSTGGSQEKAKSKESLNLYLNGNISINLLTGNTNPQIITNNINNKDSYNTNKTISYEVDSKNRMNTSILIPNKEKDDQKEKNINKVNTINNYSKNNKNKNIKNIKKLNLERKKTKKKHFRKEKLKKIKKNSNENLEDSPKHEGISEQLNSNYLKKSKNSLVQEKKENIIVDLKKQDNFLQEKIEKNDFINEESLKKLLEDQELRDFIAKKLNLVNSENKNSVPNRIHIDDAKNNDQKDIENFFNIEINKTLDSEMEKEVKINEKKIFNVKNSSIAKNKFLEKKNFTKNGKKIQINEIKKIHKNNSEYISKNDLSNYNLKYNYGDLKNNTDNTEKKNIQNNYYITDHSIKILSSDRPSVVSFNNLMGDESKRKIIDKYKKGNLKNSFDYENNNITKMLNITDIYPNQIVYINPEYKN